MTDAADPRSWAGMRVLVLAPTPTHPQDYGNRKRIFQVCQDLRGKGTEIHYVHYASETDWRQNPSLAALRAMQEAWDAHYTVPVTRPLHMPPAEGEDHRIDEWWDPAIGDMLRWLFSTRSFDACIVNYTWLSKAFEFVPRGVLKVLDTHDRFADRRAVLEANGLKPEFFYTTEVEERIALDRADVVWAIKDEEAAFFRTLTRRPVHTLPYVEPVRPLLRTEAPRGILRFGLVGARNNINLVNIRAFLEAARLYVERTLLPCRFVIAGSCCDDLAGDRLPSFVELLGRVDSLDDFYRNVDVVLAPMTFSTGLKIKVGEALHLCKAVIAHAHAFEGYAPTHPFHTLDSFQAILWACKEVVAKPEQLPQLEAASFASAMASVQAFGATLAHTAAMRWHLDPGLCIVFDAAELRSGSLIFDHVCDTARYLSHQVPVHLVLGGTLDARPDQDALYRLRQLGDIVALPELTTTDDAVAPAELLGRVRRIPLADLACGGQLALWFAGPPPTLHLRRPATVPAFLPYDAWAMRGTELGGCIEALTACFPQVYLLSRGDGPAVSGVRDRRGLRHIRTPLFFDANQSYAAWMVEAAGRRGQLLLADRADDPRLVAALAVQSRYRRGGEPPMVLLASGETGAQALQGCRLVTLDGLFRDIGATGMAPELVIDIASNPRLNAVREIFERRSIPMIRLFAPGHRPRSVSGAPRLAETGLFAGLDSLRRFVAEPTLARHLTELRGRQNGHRNDPGWALVWSLVAALMAERRRRESEPA
ncbi:Glycosyl transferases group 1 [Belnapia rosea]|uniref:Glycosyl transferases group 1 n=3 Tax=Belnapia rosea TaxID=938405 RepID=A0A1G7EMS6_9PROT|nr:Glycosyl transferases group 1 [Belnapia rosea]